MKGKYQHKGEQDLFEQRQVDDRKIEKKTKFVLPRIKSNIVLSYENIIFLVIGFVMSCIIFFSLGVEKGKQNILQISQKPKKVKIDIEKQETKREQGEYILQIAAFKKRQSAEKEIGELKKRGFKAALRKSGDYYQIYIGTFKRKDSAEELLGKLKEKYKDCYIRKVDSRQ